MVIPTLKKLGLRNKKDAETPLPKELADLPPPTEWPHFPLFLKCDPESCNGSLVVKDVHPHESCPVGIPFEFETESFRGQLLFRVRDLPHSTFRDARYFDGRNRLHQFVVQGRFKEDIAATDIAIGAEFKRRLRMPPPPFIEKIVNQVFQRVSPSVKLELSGEKPRVLASFPGCAQVFRADRPGEEPDITCFDLEENNAAIKVNNGDSDIVFPVEKKERKKIFLNDKDRNIIFGTDLVYTFEHYDDIMDYSSYTMNLKVYQFGLEKITDREPFQFLVKNTKSGKNLWCFDIFHNKILQK